MSWIVQGFLLLGIIFNVLGNLGVLIFPDVYTRLQASSTCSTTSVFSVLLATLLSAGFSQLGGKILVITLFFLISSPVASYIVARFAWNQEIVPWRKICPRPTNLQESNPPSAPATPDAVELNDRNPRDADGVQENMDT